MGGPGVQGVPGKGMTTSGLRKSTHFVLDSPRLHHRGTCDGSRVYLGRRDRARGLYAPMRSGFARAAALAVRRRRPRPDDRHPGVRCHRRLQRGARSAFSRSRREPSPWPCSSCPIAAADERPPRHKNRGQPARSAEGALIDHEVVERWVEGGDRGSPTGAPPFYSGLAHVLHRLAYRMRVILAQARHAPSILTG